MKRYRLIAICGLGLGTALGLAPSAGAAVEVKAKHLLILRPGLDAVYGTYVFAVENNGKEAERYKGTAMLPKETDDFAPQEGLEPADVTLGPPGSGGVLIDKAMSPGLNVLSLAFRVPAHYGRSAMTWTLPSTIDSLTVLVAKQGGMSLDAAQLAPVPASQESDPQFKTLINAAPLVAGSKLDMQLGAIPEGRTRLWWVGGAVGVWLAGLALWLAWRTRPKITADAGTAVLIG